MSEYDYEKEITMLSRAVSSISGYPPNEPEGEFIKQFVQKVNELNIEMEYFLGRIKQYNHKPDVFANMTFLFERLEAVVNLIANKLAELLELLEVEMSQRNLFVDPFIELGSALSTFNKELPEHQDDQYFTSAMAKRFNILVKEPMEKIVGNRGTLSGVVNRQLEAEAA